MRERGRAVEKAAAICFAEIASSGKQKGIRIWEGLRKKTSQGSPRPPWSRTDPCNASKAHSDRARSPPKSRWSPPVMGEEHEPSPHLGHARPRTYLDWSNKPGSARSSIEQTLRHVRPTWHCGDGGEGEASQHVSAHFRQLTVKPGRNRSGGGHGHGAALAGHGRGAQGGAARLRQRHRGAHVQIRGGGRRAAVADLGTRGGPVRR